jgi:hypothetical protein
MFDVQTPSSSLTQHHQLSARSPDTLNSALAALFLSPRQSWSRWPQGSAPQGRGMVGFGDKKPPEQAQQLSAAT